MVHFGHLGEVGQLQLAVVAVGHQQSACLMDIEVEDGLGVQLQRVVVGVVLSPVDDDVAVAARNEDEVVFLLDLLYGARLRRQNAFLQPLARVVDSHGLVSASSI